MSVKCKLIAATCFGVVAFGSSTLFFMRGAVPGNVIVLYLVLPTLSGALAGHVWGGPILDPVATPTSGKALLRGLGVTVRAYLIFSVLFACGLPMFETLWSSRQVIFVTAYDAHAIRAFEVQALDYVLKPFEASRFRIAVSRARAEIQRKLNGEINSRLINLLEELRNPKEYFERLAIKSNGRVNFVNVAEIDWIEAANNYVRVHSGRESYLIRETMSSLEAKLDPRRFARVHRSVIVNMGRVKQLKTMFKGEYEIVMQDGKHLPFGRAYRSRARQLLTSSG